MNNFILDNVNELRSLIKEANFQTLTKNEILNICQHFDIFKKNWPKLDTKKKQIFLKYKNIKLLNYLANDTSIHYTEDRQKILYNFIDKCFPKKHVMKTMT